MLNAIALALALLFAPPATAPSTLPSKAEVLAAIDRFTSHPGRATDVRLIRDFAENSSDVNIAADGRVLSWMVPGKKYQGADLLLVAFFAGNIKSQLESGNSQDDSYAGLLTVFKVYDKLRGTSVSTNIPEINELQAKEKRGELKAYIASVKKEK